MESGTPDGMLGMLGMLGMPKKAVELGNRPLQFDRSSPFLATPLVENTAFLLTSHAMELQSRQTLSSLGPILAFHAPSPTAS